MAKKQRAATSSQYQKRVDAYIKSVLTGKISAGKYVKLAVERQVRDLEEGAGRGLRFDPAAAERVCTFFERYLRHSKGVWAGKPFKLEPWECFILWVIFGWKREDGTRRFRVAYDSVARKNGKSTIGAGVGLYLLIADQEEGAEVYSAATKRDQAKIVFDEAYRMVKASPDLRKFANPLRNNINVPRLNAKYEPLGRDSDTMDGLNVHGVVIDELHAHKDREVWDILETAKGARAQPLTFVITTAGFDTESICHEEDEYSRRVLEGEIEDDERFVFIASIDEGDSWQDEDCWPKANPNLGISPSWEFLRAQAKKARETPAFENNFRRLLLNEWTQQSERWLRLDLWDKSMGEVVADELAGLECYAGLDLANTVDIAALVLVFPVEEAFKVRPFFWIPGEDIRERGKRDKVPYETWVREGLITATPGDVVDYSRIREDMLDLRSHYTFREIAYDPWNALHLVGELEDAFNFVEVRQGYKTMGPAMKELLRLVTEGRVEHGGHPVLRWMAGNLMVKQDSNGNWMPDKKSSAKKIDGMVALTMALYRATLHLEGPSVYEERGIRTL